MRLRNYSIISKCMLLTLVFATIGGAFVQQCIAGEKTKSPPTTMLIDDFSKEGLKKSFSTNWHFDNPTYKQVCTDKTGHAEAVEVIYDPSKTNHEKLARLFFETHDFTQLNRQGPDIGKQYRSAVFYLDEKQKDTAAKLIETLKQKGFGVKTEITQAGKFWPAENHHQDYYENNGKTPYCHIYRKIF